MTFLVVCYIYISLSLIRAWNPFFFLEVYQLPGYLSSGEEKQHRSIFKSTSGYFLLPFLTIVGEQIETKKYQKIKYLLQRLRVEFISFLFIFLYVSLNG